jgi:hypothetical protein
MKREILAAVALVVILAVSAGVAPAYDFDDESHLRTAMPLYDDSHKTISNSGARLETLWIFDADYSTVTGDNAGWIGLDRSGTLASDNFWHHDTIRINGFTHLGDSTWWCGTYNGCWRQPRGYGNDWIQILERHFTESSTATSSVVLEYDQRYAMEKDYDYGYLDIRSSATSDTWRTVWTITNPGFAGTPGRSQDWNSTAPTGPGHMVVDVSTECVGVEFDLRFRFDSDLAYSSKDQFNNPPLNSVLDGAWQLDNIELITDGTPAFFDDAESGNMGWIHDDIIASGQTGIAFYRGRFGFEFVTGREFTCDDRPVGTWMWGAVDPFTKVMVDDQVSWLMSPPIDISGAPKLVGHWDFWLDMPRDSEDICNLLLASSDQIECVQDPEGYVDENPGWWYGDPGWRIRYDDWDAFAGNDWLSTLWIETNDGESAGHWAGILMNRQRVGIPSGDAGTTFEIDVWNRFNDWFIEQVVTGPDGALEDTMQILVKDDDDVTSVSVVASNDGGTTWNTYPGRRESAQSNNWYLGPPTAEMTAGSEIWYYIEAMDGVGNVAIYPSDAPDHYFEMSILPIHASTSNPGMLLVDKHGRTTPGEQRYRGGYPLTRPLIDHHSEYYYVEMLEILGYEWDTYDVEVPSGSIKSEGPDTFAYKYYDTQIWFFNEFNAYLLWPSDQENLIAWLNKAGEGKERNLLLTGNDLGYELMETGKETLFFYQTWLASDYVANSVGTVTVDSVPGLREHVGGFTFMDYDDSQCIIRGGCPVLNHFDVVDPYSGVPGAETVADYVKLDSSTRSAGVAYTNQTLGYQTVNLGFGMEFMMDSMETSRNEGYYVSGIYDRVNLMGNILGDGTRVGYFGLTPDGPGTGTDEGFRNELSHAYPNPFNPMTKIAYSVKEAGPVTIEVYNVAGKVVRTLLDAELEGGSSGFVTWDGLNDAGDRCASGVYFYRIAAPGFTESHKMIMLK